MKRFIFVGAWRAILITGPGVQTRETGIKRDEPAR
jgi:hypothetical protein